MRWNLQAIRTFRFLLRIIAFQDILRIKPRWNWKRRFLHKKAACIPAVFPSLMRQKKKKPRIYWTSSLNQRAIDGARTRGLDLGKVARYQLRHYRIFNLPAVFSSRRASITIHELYKIVNNFFSIIIPIFWAHLLFTVNSEWTTCRLLL